MVLLFLTTQSALRAEEILLEAGVTVDVVPRPEGAPGGLCGLALDVVAEELAEADYLLAEADIEFRLFDDSAPVEPRADSARGAERPAAVSARPGAISGSVGNDGDRADTPSAGGEHRVAPREPSAERPDPQGGCG